MTITIKIDDLPVEVRIVHYLPPEPPHGLYGHSSTAEVEWDGPRWLRAMANQFGLWGAIDELVLEAITESRKQGSE